MHNVIDFKATRRMRAEYWRQAGEPQPREDAAPHCEDCGGTGRVQVSFPDPETGLVDMDDCACTLEPQS